MVSVDYRENKVFGDLFHNFISRDLRQLAGRIGDENVHLSLEAQSKEQVQASLQVESDGKKLMATTVSPNPFEAYEFVKCVILDELKSSRPRERRVG